MSRFIQKQLLCVACASFISILMSWLMRLWCDANLAQHHQEKQLLYAGSNHTRPFGEVCRFPSSLVILPSHLFISCVHLLFLSFWILLPCAKRRNETSQLSPIKVRRGAALVAGFSFVDFDQLYQLWFHVTSTTKLNVWCLFSKHEFWVRIQCQYYCQYIEYIVTFKSNQREFQVSSWTLTPKFF